MNKMTLIGNLTRDPETRVIHRNGGESTVTNFTVAVNDGYGDLGKVIGFTAARFVEKKWVRFQPLKKGWQSLLLCLVGLVPVVLLKDLVRPILTGALGNHWGKLLFSVIHVFWFITLFPLILKLLGRAMKLDSAEALKN